MSKIGTQPYISLNGANTKGPRPSTHQPHVQDEINGDIPNPKTKIDVTKAVIVSLVIPNSFANWFAAGAIIEDATGLMKV